jgi:hypothetical protein
MRKRLSGLNVNFIGITQQKVIPMREMGPGKVRKISKAVAMRLAHSLLIIDAISLKEPGQDPSRADNTIKMSSLDKVVDGRILLTPLHAEKGDLICGGSDERAYHECRKGQVDLHNDCTVGSQVGDNLYKSIAYAPL